MATELSPSDEAVFIGHSLDGFKAGCPEGQIDNFLRRGYTPLPWQWSFHAAAREADQPQGPVEIMAGGARGPGKSHGIFAQASLDDCQRMDGLKVLFLRKTAVSAQESFQDLINKVILAKLPFTRSNSVITFENASRIILGGFHNERDIDKYIGVEYDVIVIEELNQLTLEKFEMLLGSLRTSKEGWRPRVYGSFNPGGIGHAWVKERYVMPYRLKKQRRARFVPATFKANIYLDDGYTEYLLGLSGDLGKAWREGDFDLFAGQYFSEWRYDIHVCDPFTIPNDWRRFKAGDYGNFAPSSVGWYAVSPDGKLYRYRELYEKGLSYSALAAKTVEMTGPDEKIDYEVWDPAIWSRKGERDDELTGADVYRAKIKELTTKEPRLVRGDNARVVGWGVLREYLKPVPGSFEGEITAKLQVFSTCTNFIRTIPALQHDEHNPEDVDTDGEDHCADEGRYAVMSEPRPSITAAEKEDRIFQQKMREKRAKMGTTHPRYRRRGVH